MKIKIGPYPNRAICNLHTNYMNKKYGYVDWPEYKQKGLRIKAQPFAEAWREQAEDIIQSIYNCTINLFLDRREQKVKIHIDKWDTWSMDHTLAPIILPMLIQLKAEKHGAPQVDYKDVPKELRATKKQIEAYSKNGVVDPKHFERWDWIMDEMIWAFEQKNRDRWEDDYYGPYIESEDKRELFGRFEWTDDEGRQKHQERMSNGFRLFGKYYENLWD
jgi:hypothetical protein